MKENEIRFGQVWQSKETGDQFFVTRVFSNRVYVKPKGKLTSGKLDDLFEGKKDIPILILDFLNTCNFLWEPKFENKPRIKKILD